MSILVAVEASLNFVADAYGGEFRRGGVSEKQLANDDKLEFHCRS
jgi:hypothetical protein